MKAGTIASGSFAQALSALPSVDPGATIWGFRKSRIDYRITVTDARGIVVFDSRGQDLGKDHSQWNDVLRTLRGEYGARSSGESEYDADRTVMHVAAPIYDPGDGRTLIGVLTLSQPNRSIEPFIVASQRSILLRGAWLDAADLTGQHEGRRGGFFDDRGAMEGDPGGQQAAAPDRDVLPAAHRIEIDAAGLDPRGAPGWYWSP